MDLFLPLIHNLFASGAYLILIIATLSLWINRRFWIWGPLTVLSLALAYIGGIVELKGIVIISALFLCQAALTQDIGGFWRLFAAMIGSMISFGLMAHMIVGFHNPLLLKDWHSSTDALGMNIYIGIMTQIIFLIFIQILLKVNLKNFVKLN